MPGNWPVPFGKGPSEKDPNHGHLVGGLLHLTGGGWKRSLKGHRASPRPYSVGVPAAGVGLRVGDDVLAAVAGLA